MADQKNRRQAGPIEQAVRAAITAIAEHDEQARKKAEHGEKKEDVPRPFLDVALWRIGPGKFNVIMQAVHGKACIPQAKISISDNFGGNFLENAGLDGLVIKQFEVTKEESRKVLRFAVNGKPMDFWKTLTYNESKK